MHGGLRCGMRGWHLKQLRSRHTAKSIAACRVQLQKKLLKDLHGGVRGGKRGWRLKQPPQKQLPLAECNRLKICVVGCDVICGVLRAFQLRFASASPQNQLQLAECTCRKSCWKICVVCCDVICGVAPKKVRSKLGLGAKPTTPCIARIGSTAKSIAACKMHLLKICTVGCGVICGVGG